MRVTLLRRRAKLLLIMDIILHIEQTLYTLGPLLLFPSNGFYICNAFGALALGQSDQGPTVGPYMYLRYPKSDLVRRFWLVPQGRSGSLWGRSGRKTTAVAAGLYSTRNLKEQVGGIFRWTCSTHRVKEINSDLDRSLRADLAGTFKVTNGRREGNQLFCQSGLFPHRN